MSGASYVCIQKILQLKTHDDFITMLVNAEIAHVKEYIRHSLQRLPESDLHFRSNDVKGRVKTSLIVIG